MVAIGLIAYGESVQAAPPEKLFPMTEDRISIAKLIRAEMPFLRSIAKAMRIIMEADVKGPIRQSGAAKR